MKMSVVIQFENNILFAFQNCQRSGHKTILLSFCWCEKWFLILREDHALHTFQKKFRKAFEPTRNEVTEQFITLHNEELCDVYRSASIVGARVA
jgi:hypothetical protein